MERIEHGIVLFLGLWPTLSYLSAILHKCSYIARDVPHIGATKPTHWYSNIYLYTFISQLEHKFLQHRYKNAAHIKYTKYIRNIFIFYRFTCRGDRYVLRPDEFRCAPRYDSPPALRSPEHAYADAWTKSRLSPNRYAHHVTCNENVNYENKTFIGRG